jgi:opacity protein-like surface antigen
MRVWIAIVALFVARTLCAADFELGAQHVVMKANGEAGDLNIETSRGFAASGEAFWTEGFSTRLAVTFLNPAAILFPSDPPPDDVDLGTLGLDLYSATARWHVAPRSRFSAYAGAGGALANIGNLDDQFGEDVEIEFEPETAWVVEAGLRYRFRPGIYLEAGATYMGLDAESDVRRSNDSRLDLPERVGIDPLIVSVGAAWRF